MIFKLNKLHLLVVFFWVTNIFAQEGAFERHFSEIDASISKKVQQRNELSRELQLNDQRFQELRKDESLNYFQRQKLENLLRRSQDLANQIEAIDLTLQQLESDLQKSGKKLIRMYDKEIKEKLASIESAQLKSEMKQETIRQVEVLRVKKDAIREKIDDGELKQIQISTVKIEPDDAAQTIEQKADLLKDQEEKIRRQSQKLRLKIVDLQEEQELLNRIDDLMTDLALFDQQEEILSNLDGNGTERDALSSADNTSQESGLRELQNSFVTQKDFDFSSLSPVELEDVIQLLKEQELRSQILADSLGRQAERFYQKARESKE